MESVLLTELQARVQKPDKRSSQYAHNQRLKIKEWPDMTI